LYRCYSYIFCFHFKGWPKRRIIHIASSVVLQNAENDQPILLTMSMISGACTNNGSKIKLSTNRGHITFPCIWVLTGITFARKKSITIARKIYLRFLFTFARITCYLEYIWFTHNIFCILQHVPMNFNIWTAKFAFKIIVFFYTCMFHYFFLIYISYIFIDVILIFLTMVQK
jgi:hypothetical protein